jgi:hypothetical protein
LAALLGFFVFVIVAVVVLAIIGAILRALVIVLRAVGILCVAGALGAAIGLCAAAFGVESEYAWAIGLIVTVLAAAAIFQRGSSRWRRGWDAREEVFPVPVALEPEAYAGAIEPRAERKVSKAWEQLTGMLPAADVRGLNRARDACARLLAASDAQPLALELMETAVLIRRNLPELAHRNASLWSDADEAERAGLSAGIVADVALLEKRAEGQLSALRRNRRDDLHAIRNHLAARIDEGA